MRKIIELGDEFFATGEATVQPILPWGSGRIDTARITKHASEALDYIKNVAPEPGKTQLLLLALGGSETYGPNRNGDGFPEYPVAARSRIKSADRKWFVPPGEELTNHYQSFEKNPAHAFKHHVNRDPSKASGYVKKAFWNPRMHRVELLVSVDNEKDPEWVQRTNDGEFVPVSMGCFLAGALVTMADGTRRPIEDIRVGDVVRTHLGRGRKVTETHRRPYRGNVHTIRAEAHREIHATEEHPFWATPIESVKERSRPNSGKWTWRNDARVAADWTHAGCLDDQLLLAPIDRTETRPDYLTRAFARLFGYYMAEGHIIWREGKPYGIELTTHVDDPVHAEIEPLCEAFGARNKPWTFERKNSADARGVMICDDRLAALCYAHGGAHAKDKRLSEEAMRWACEMQREMFGAYANGDGHGRDGWLKVSTASDALAAQWIELLPRLGILASHNTLTHKAGSGFSAGDTYEHVIHIGIQWAWKLQRVCAKVTAREINARKESRRIVDDYVCTPIREVSVRYMETDVYNFEVDEDNSYLVEGLAVHNCRIKRDVCSICGNEAPTRAQYCDHAKYQMNEILPDGQKVYVHNPSPDFFDISRVFRPADRTGYTLKKVAYVHEVRLSAELGERADALALKSAVAQKLSDMNKTIEATPVATSVRTPSDDAFVVKFRDHAYRALKKSASIDTRQLQRYPLGEVVHASLKTGFLLRDDEFIPLAVSKLTGAWTPLAADTVRKTAAAAKVALDAFAEHPALLEEILESDAFDAQKCAADVVAFFEQAREKRGYAGEYLYRRLVPEGVGLRRDEQPNTDVLHVGDYETTRGAARDAQDAITRAHAKKILGGSALLLGGYKALAAAPGLKAWRPALAVGAGYGAVRLPHERPDGDVVMSVEGVPVPVISEFVKKQASAVLVHLIECSDTPTARDAFACVKVSTDTALDDVAQALGAIILT